MVNSPSPKGKAFLLGQAHTLGDGGGKSVLAGTKRGVGRVLRAGAAGSGSQAKWESSLWSRLSPTCRGEAAAVTSVVLAPGYRNGAFCLL